MKNFMLRLKDKKNEKQQMGQHSLGNTTCFWVTTFIAFCKVSGSKYFQVHLQIQVQDLE